jgi:DNA invertase Pin-like site-specific DNA recombinase
MHEVEPNSPAPAMRALAYKRRSQDSGTGVSEEIQDEEVRQVVERLGGEVVEWLPPDLDKSSWTLERPSFQRALKLLGDGKANVVIVAKLNRLTRRRKHWEEILDLAEAQGWRPVSAEFPELDLLSNEGRMIAGFFIDQGEREYRDKRKGYDQARANAVLRHGVHGGDVPPLGYDFTVRGYDKKRNSQRGPLTPNADAPRVIAAFEARAEGASWKEVIHVLGVKSTGGAQTILCNPVYTGQARSGDYVKENAHPALVDDVLFRRVQRQRIARSVSYKDNRTGETRTGALLGGKILRCAACGYSLTNDSSKAGAFYRCKYAHCSTRASITAARIEPVALAHALAAHAVLNPMHIADINAATLVVFEEELAKTQADFAEVEAANERGEFSPVAYGKALTVAETALAAAQLALADAEASRGWFGISTEAVQRRLFTDTIGPLPDPAKVKNIAEARDFVRQMVRIVVKPVGCGRKVPVNERIEVEILTPCPTQAPESAPAGESLGFETEVA